MPGTDDLGGYVLSALTGSLTGQAMTLDQIIDVIIGNGWLEDVPETRVQVWTKLREQIDQGWAEPYQPGYRVTARTTEMLFGGSA